MVDKFQSLLPNPYHLIIFDCDGTLVDSERIYAGILSDIMQEQKMPPYTPDQILADFQGMTLSDMRVIIQKRHGVDLPPDIARQYVSRFEHMIEEHLHAVAGAHDILSRLKPHKKLCVASNGERENVISSLKSLQFNPYFSAANIFTKSQVSKGKPAPDLFLFAAEKMGCEPHQCMVIEDSVSGVRAGAAAGMYVVGFTGTAHEKNTHAATLKQAGAHVVIDQLIHISDVLTH